MAGPECGPVVSEISGLAMKHEVEPVGWKRESRDTDVGDRKCVEKREAARPPVKVLYVVCVYVVCCRNNCNNNKNDEQR